MKVYFSIGEFFLQFEINLFKIVENTQINPKWFNLGKLFCKANLSNIGLMKDLTKIKMLLFEYYYFLQF